MPLVASLIVFLTNKSFSAPPLDVSSGNEGLDLGSSCNVSDRLLFGIADLPVASMCHAHTVVMLVFVVSAFLRKVDVRICIILSSCCLELYVTYNNSHAVGLR